jgi:hypothetical protein
MATTHPELRAHALSDPDTAHALVHCEACGNDVVPEKPSRLWWLAVLGTWLYVFAMAPIAVIFPLCFVGIPLMLGIGMPLIAYTSDKVHRPAECPACRRYLE